MAIVQLIYLTAGDEDNISDFWYYDLSEPNKIVFRSLDISELTGKNAPEHFQAVMKTSSWPKIGKTMTRTLDARLAFCFAVAWTKDRPAGRQDQPKERYWIIEPAAGLVLYFSAKRQEAVDKYKEFLGGCLDNL